MIRGRHIKKSVITHARGLFAAPPSGSFINAYNAYDEYDLRKFAASGVRPNDPFVFVTDTDIRPVDFLLPLVMVEIGRRRRGPYELGNRKGGIYEVGLHVIGRTRGERDDLADHLEWCCYERVTTIPLYDYTSGSGVAAGVAEVGDEIVVEDLAVDSEDASLQGKLDHWTIVSFDLRSKQ